MADQRDEPFPKAWSDDALLPRHGGESWAVWKRTAIPCDSLDDVKAFVRHWNPTHAVFVGAPGARDFVVPHRIGGLRQSLCRRLRRQASVAAAAFVLLGLLMVVDAYATGTLRPDSIALIPLLFGTVQVVDHAIWLKDDDGIDERVRYFYWISHSPAVRTGFRFWLALVVVVGLTQWILQAGSDLDTVVGRYGLMVRAAQDGELWRYLTGPFFHASLAHYFNNAMLSIFLGAALWPTFGLRSVGVFVAGAVAGEIVQILLQDARFDAFTGMSGGVFALYGLMAFTGFRFARYLPRGMALLVLGVAVASAISGRLLSENSALIAHIAGLGFGAVCAWALSIPAESLGRHGPGRSSSS